MLADIFKNRLFIGALVFFILCVIGGTLYIGYVEQRGAKKLAEAEERIKQLTEKQQQPTAKAPVGDTSQGGHLHSDGTFHAEAHDPVEPQPIAGKVSPGGHWSEAYLPPLKELKQRYADDADAMLVLNNVEVLQKYGLHSNNPEAGEARTALVKFFNSIFDRINIRGNPEGRMRVEELLKLKWSLYESPPGSSAELAQWAPLKGE